MIWRIVISVLIIVLGFLIAFAVDSLRGEEMHAEDGYEERGQQEAESEEHLAGAPSVATGSGYRVELLMG